MTDDEIRDGFFKDKYGRWQAERRSGQDRRAIQPNAHDHERRKFFRRKADRELLNKDHKTMIEDALEDFAEEHGGHL
ncbi:MAG TPA: hypothetical protein PLI09_14910 [Candidatus Hydrogenedentes bacterium]|nr:hypothetical protein [Candidatus Hydrogenedentota bacterium]